MPAPRMSPLMSLEPAECDLTSPSSSADVVATGVSVNEFVSWHVEPLMSLEPPPSSSADVSAAVVADRVVVAVPNFATHDELQILRAAADHAEAHGLQNVLTSDATRLRCEVFGRQLSRGRSVAPCCGEAAQALVRALVQRSISFVQHHLPELAEALDLVACKEGTKLVYSEGEPAINIYRGPGGSFSPHQDAQSLTMTLALSDTGDFDGGGTSFYPAAELPAARRGKVTPSSVLRPAAGTALLWSGTLIHAGAEVTAGRRLLLVASFTPVYEAQRGRLSHSAASGPTTGEREVVVIDPG